MVVRYMFDTDTCIATIKDRPESIRRRLVELLEGEVGISSIVAAELWYGVSLSQRQKQNKAALKDFMEYVRILDWPYDASPVYGRVRSLLKKKGTPVGAMDLLIASHALWLNVTLVTNNTKEFSRIPGLKIENWVSENPEGRSTTT